MGLTVVVGTESELKLRAVCTAARALGLSFHVVPCKAESGVSAQPVSAYTTESGVRNRIRNAEKLCPDADLYIGIESGLVRMTGDKWFDRSHVLVRTRAGEEYSSKSALFPIPHWMVKRTLEKHISDASYDLGALIQELSGGGEKDVETYLSGGKTSREQMIATTVQLALTPLFNQERYRER